MTFRASPEYLQTQGLYKDPLMQLILQENFIGSNVLINDTLCINTKTHLNSGPGKGKLQREV